MQIIPCIFTQPVFSGALMRLFYISLLFVSTELVTSVNIIADVCRIADIV